MTKIKTLISFWLFCSLTLLLSSSIEETPQDIDYFGQESPGFKAVLFAPELFVTENHEHSTPTFSPDGSEVYWSVIPPTGQSNRRQKILRMQNRNGKWSNPEIAPFSGQFSEGGPVFSHDGKRLFYYSRRPIEKDGQQKRDSDIWYVERDNDGWSEPVRLDFNTPNLEGMLSVGQNGSLYFCAQYSGPEGPMYIFRSELVDGKYSNPVNIGRRINNAHIVSPFIAPDESYIIFTPVGLPGGSGLYISFRNPDGNWHSPVKMDGRVNIAKSQRFPNVSPDGKYFFFTSTASGSEEIYWIDAQIIEEHRLK